MARRRYTLLIDVEASGFRNGVRFWSEALGAPARHSGDPKDPFIELPAALGDMHVEMQRINGPSRYHLDLYAPNVDREARRLEALGAQKVKREESWWVMQAPTGHLFCIIPESAPEPDADDDFDEYEDDEDDFDEDDEFEDDDFDDDDDPPEPDPPKKYPRLRAVPNN